ncbi:hypothetical protein EV702DRAFT_1202967 [Suillus placidus]|uniref:Uncharacterized protein n=1 Tax=Suillus placidus TaxID=48579 RepID=A0A9P6ZKB8_9AGAM|nr:hypothetical protein EV702DRAFT_1202967 [Suillus placidus]
MNQFFASYQHESTYMFDPSIPPQTSPSLPLAFSGDVPFFFFPISHFEPRPVVNPSPTLPRRRDVPPSLFPTAAQNGNVPPSLFPTAAQNGSVPPSLFPTAAQNGSVPPSLFPTAAQNGNVPPSLFSHGFPSPSRKGSVPPSLFLMASVPFSKWKRPLLDMEASLLPCGRSLPFIAPPPLLPPACLQNRRIIRRVA